MKDAIWLAIIEQVKHYVMTNAIPCIKKDRCNPQQQHGSTYWDLYYWQCKQKINRVFGELLPQNAMLVLKAY